MFGKKISAEVRASLEIIIKGKNLTRLQINSQSTSSGRQQEDEVGRSRSVESFDRSTTSLGGNGTVESLGLITSNVAVVMENIAVEIVHQSVMTHTQSRETRDERTAFEPSD